MMNDNTDFEIIKKELNQIPDGYESVNQCKATYEILKAAERMTAEIGRLEGIEGQRDKVLQQNIDLTVEIDRLKAELEGQKHKATEQGRNACKLFDEAKRLQVELERSPKVVYCKECIYNKSISDTEIIKPPQLGDRCPKKLYFPYDAGNCTTEYQKVELLFCSFGVKKESEEER